MRQYYVTSADGTMISVSITGTGPPLVVSPGSLATAEDWQFEFVRMPGDAIAALRQQPIWSRLATMTPSWTREVRAIDQFGGDLERFRAISVPVLLIVGEPARPGWPIFPAASRWSCLMRSWPKSQARPTTHTYSTRQRSGRRSLHLPCKAPGIAERVIGRPAAMSPRTAADPANG